MTALVLRTTQGTPLSIAQMDTNLTALNGNSAGLVSISSITTLTGGTGVSSPNNLGEIIEITAAVAVTMPLANTAANGSVVQFVSTVTGATVVAQGSDTFGVGSGTVVTFTLNVGDTLELVSNGTNQWVAASGTATLPYSSQANTLVNGIQTISVGTGGSYTLSTSQAAAQIMKFTGTLTSNSTVVVPTSGKTFTVWNATTGAFTLTVKTASGSGILVTQGFTQELICEGSNIVIASNDLAGAGIAPLVNPVLTNPSAASSPAQTDSSTKLATTANVNTAVNGVQTIAVGSGPAYSLTAAQAVAQIMIFTGALTSNIVVTIPATSKTFVADNRTTGAFTLTVIASGGTGISITQGKRQELVCDGTNVLLASSDLTGAGIASIIQLSFDNRATLRTIEGPTTAHATVESLGLFTWSSGLNDLDDDETCFLSATGTWVLSAADPDLSLFYANTEFQDIRGHFLNSIFNNTTTSLATVTSVTLGTITINNASVGDSVIITPTGSLTYANVYGYVSSPNTVTINATNGSASAATLPVGQWTVLVIKNLSF